jgi:hypothetical protein
MVLLHFFVLIQRNEAKKNQGKPDRSARFAGLTRTSVFKSQIPNYKSPIRAAEQQTCLPAGRQQTCGAGREPSAINVPNLHRQTNIISTAFDDWWLHQHRQETSTNPLKPLKPLKPMKPPKPLSPNRHHFHCL